ncbi:Csu type fimbrial protein [Sphingopyxis yananensis]|jgi:spore coat protein U-like protein|uniref:Csu type fimbrial protein n=1 Tax=Sphingopyxis yananensis TaxID=2886687 RepID=UPI001D11DDBF|nr:spore coat U domain-containing protein [Sphingopyxis yananensis]MCC2601946.1 spore coat U domain-containing protein [Sphingopyxis yananensis]
MAADRTAPSSSTGIILSLLGFVCLCGLTSVQTSAQSIPIADFDVNASVALGCWVNGTGQSGAVGRIALLDFGSTPASVGGTRTTSTQETQSLSMRCTPNTKLIIRLNEGRNASASSRRLRRGTSGNMMDYRLCHDAACALPLALMDEQTRTLSIADAANVRLVYYAQVDVPNHLPPGLYTDDIMVTLSW